MSYNRRDRQELPRTKKGEDTIDQVHGEYSGMEKRQVKDQHLVEK